MKNRINSKNPTHLTVTGEAEAVKLEIYRLFNAGVISGMPDAMKDPDEEKIPEGFISLECKTYGARFHSGLLTLADAELQKELPFPVKCADRKEWRGLRAVRAGEILNRDFFIQSDAQMFAEMEKSEE